MRWFWIVSSIVISYIYCSSQSPEPSGGTAKGVSATNDSTTTTTTTTTATTTTTTISIGNSVNRTDAVTKSTHVKISDDHHRKTTESTKETAKNETDERQVDLEVLIRVADCHALSLESSFTVYLATLDYEGIFLNWYKIPKHAFKQRGQDSFRYQKQETVNHSIKDCLEEGRYDCHTSADVVFIEYNNEPPANMAIKEIAVTVEFKVDSVRKRVEYSHPVLRPCVSWLNERALYQIGPRFGLFLRHKHSTKFDNMWIRDWI